MVASATPDFSSSFLSNRAMLLGLAYRMLGCVADAEDIVHEVYLKWNQADKTQIQNAKHWLIKVTSNLALDALKSARVQRENYIGTWLPEPLVEVSSSIEEQALQDHSVSMALLTVLEKLNPLERASFILHDIFHFSFDEIADFQAVEPAACRKQASRARAKIDQEVQQEPITRTEHKEFIQHFFNAVKLGDLSGLREILHSDAILYADGGGKAAAAPIPIMGCEKVMRFLYHYVTPDFSKADIGERHFEILEFNGSPGLVVRDNQGIVTAYQFEIRQGKIQNLYAHRNPEKLRYLNAE